ncbi:similar to Saccharomyces cerevisiae YDR441C APT2 Apparent pseudogene, not transcribed or translated under normal conditions [Maudiozyma saulgeensis]|nr:similar to Saccharomyces cerevisiae YDR441C APT2 Apparent pseudogene, not transcribed or translated under normal conditions [Kazachstania saulgeensis]
MPKDIESLKSVLHKYPNFPVKGVLFEDFLPIFRDHKQFTVLIDAFKSHLEEQFPNTKIDYIVGIESRGFLFGPTLALAMNIGFVPIRKEGKLPGECVSAVSEMEYGSNTFEIQKNVIPPNSNVIILDDILATGGTARAAFNLLENLQANILEFDFVMELNFLKGRHKLGAPVFTLLKEQEQALKSK